MDLTRREFVKTTALATAALAVGNSFATETVGGKSTVYVGKGKAADIIPKIFDKLGGIGAFVKPGARVMIKPNMSFANPPDWATTTSPEAVYTVAKLCLDAGAKRVIVCDYTLRDPDQCKDKTGIAAAVKNLKGAVVFTPTDPALFVEKSSPKATLLTKVQIVKELDRADLLISLPIAKSHDASGISLNMKGLMGLIYDRGIMHSAMDLHKAIPEQLYYIKPHVCLIDASRALLDNGPAGPGQVAQLDQFVGGLDPVAVDSFGATLASWYGRTFEGKNVQHIKYAAEMGFGNCESSKISVVAV